MTIPKEPQERRSQLLNSAEALFMEKGYEAATVNDIIAREGIAKGTFYHYFRSKEEVLTALVERVWDQFEDEAHRIIDDPSLSTMEKVERVFGTTIALKKSKIYLVSIMNQEQNVLLLDKLRREGQTRFTPLLTRLVDQGVREGVFDTPYPRHAVEFVIRSIGDPTIVTPPTEEEGAMQEWLEALGDILERVLGAPHGSFRTLMRSADQQMRGMLHLQIKNKDG